MANHTENAPYQGSELSLVEVVSLLWANRWFITGFTAACVALTLVVAFVVPKEYEVAVTLLPASDKSGTSQLGGLAGVASQLGGLASLAGLSIGGSDQAQEAIATLQSEALTSRYVAQETLLPVLFSRRWDATNKRWKGTKIPTLWEANQYFKKNIRTVSENAKTGIITLSIEWKDAKQAADWANGIVKMTNEYLRQKALNESIRNVDYLTKQATETSIVEVKNAIYSLLEAEIKKQMVARGREEYSLRVVDPATVPDRETSPKKLIWCFAAACLGGIFAAGIVLVRALFAQSQRRLHP